MPNPKRRHSKARKNKRRSHHGLTVTPSMDCPQCGSAKRPHTICNSCGHYDKNKPVIVEVQST